MKRPEGFDRPAPSTRSQGSAGARTALQERTRPRPATPADGVPEHAKPTAPPKDRAARTPRIRRASADRTAAAELRAAERSRRRHDQRELRRFTRRSRRRRIGTAIGAGVVLLLIGMVLVAVYSPLLALRTITVDGTTRLDPAAVQSAVDGQLGTPLALLDEQRLNAQLAEFTLIRSYVTEIVPPSTLLIHIVERVPVGVVQRGSTYDLVDPAGVTVESGSERTPGVPLIQLVGSEEVGGTAFDSITEVLLALPDATVAQVDTISARTHDDVTFTMAGGVQVVWGSVDDTEGKVQKLAALLTARGGQAGEYDVSAPGTAVFRHL